MISAIQEQGKLSISDTLDKYFPEYEHAKQITLKDMLAMRSGIPNPTEDLYDYVSVDSTEAENVEAIKKYVFEKPLDFEPDTSYAYSNTNYFLLANIIEQISGQSYNEFLRENILTPLKMTHTGTIIELGDSPAWTQGVEYKNIDLEPGLTKGAGDVISNAADMTTWLKALSSGKVVSENSVGKKHGSVFAVSYVNAAAYVVKDCLQGRIGACQGILLDSLCENGLNNLNRVRNELNLVHEPVLLDSGHKECGVHSLASLNNQREGDKCPYIIFGKLILGLKVRKGIRG